MEQLELDLKGGSGVSLKILLSLIDDYNDSIWDEDSIVPYQTAKQTLLEYLDALCEHGYKDDLS